MLRKMMFVWVALALAAGFAGVSTGSADDMEKAVATFAGGCFWCMEPPFDALEGVYTVESGYTGGHKKHPTYKEVCTGETGHAESIQVVYDPGKLSYEKLLDVFWHNIDPTSGDGQFCDRGNQYRPEIFYHTDEQKQLAEASKKKLEESGRFKKIAVNITAASTFYPAEDYHQEYYKKNPEHYKSYRMGCGRDRRLHELWGDEAAMH